MFNWPCLTQDISKYSVLVCWTWIKEGETLEIGHFLSSRPKLITALEMFYQFTVCPLLNIETRAKAKET